MMKKRKEMKRKKMTPSQRTNYEDEINTNFKIHNFKKYQIFKILF